MRLIDRILGVEMNPWEVLGLKPGATAEEITGAFRKRLHEVHPDLHPDDPQANEKTARVISAYGMLTDKDKSQVDVLMRQHGFSTMSITVIRNGKHVQPTTDDVAWAAKILEGFKKNPVHLVILG